MINLSPYPEYTKQTRTNNNIENNNFLRPVLSNNSIPITSNHEHYINDNNSNNLMVNSINIERNSMSTRNDNCAKKMPVQQNILNNTSNVINGSFSDNYYTMNFDNMNHNNSHEINNFLTRNPVNTRRDTIEKSRKEDLQYFMKSQGGNLDNFTDFKVENTRKVKSEINSSNYIPMPRTMAIPKENI